MSEPANVGFQRAKKNKYKKWKHDTNIPMPYKTRQKYLQYADLPCDFDEISNLEYQEEQLPSDLEEVVGEIFSDESSGSSDDNHHNTNNIQNQSDQNTDNEYDFLKMNVEQLRAIINDDGAGDIVSDDDDDDDEDDDNIDDERINVNGWEAIGSDSVYPGCKKTLDQAVLDLMDIYLKKKISKATLICFLRLIHDLLPKHNQMPKTIYQLFKYIRKRAPAETAIKHYYCINCIAYKNADDQAAVCSTCKKTQASRYFFELDISNQIRFLFEYRNLAKKLMPLKESQDEHILTDFRDGSEYKRANCRPDRKPHDLTLILNTDGLSLVKSSKSNCWPLMFMIAELPPHERENFIVVTGLWYDPDKKPLMNTFLRPFCLKLKQCYEEGVQWTDPETKQIYISKIVAPLFIADAPARADILNMQNFNGKFGCNICEIMTSRSNTLNKGGRAIRVYAFNEQPSNLRTETKIKAQAHKAEQAISKSRDKKKVHVTGIKGFSILSAIPLLYLATCVIPEFLHSVLLGTGKQIGNTWTNVKGVWSIKKYQDDIENFIKNIRPPVTFHRMPRSIFLIHFFKAWEVLVWILYYSIPACNGKLPDSHLQHWMLFVNAIYILLQEQIQREDLIRANLYLRTFVRDIKELYNDRAYTYNVHQMLHLALCVERWAALHLTSAFPFENYNGFLAHCVHGSKHQGEEMMNNLLIVQGTQILRNSCNDNAKKDTEKKKFELLGASRHPRAFISALENTILMNNNLNINDIMIYSRAKLHGVQFSSQFYKITKTESSYVRIMLHNKKIYGSIRFFFQNMNNIFVMLQHLTIDSERMFIHKETHAQVKHILPFHMENQYSLLKAVDMQSIDHLIKVGDYVCEQPNHYTAIF